MVARLDDVDDRLAVEAEVEEDPVVAELEVAVDQGDLAVDFAMEGDRRVDGQRRRAHAALGAVEGQDRGPWAVVRRPGSWARSGPAGS